MLSLILNDALQFASTPDLAPILLASRHFSAVAEGIVAGRTLRAVWFRLLCEQIVTTALNMPSGPTSIQAVILSSSDDVETKLRPLLLGGIVELFALHTNALAPFIRQNDGSQLENWFLDELSSLLVGGIVSQTLRLHLSNDASLDAIYAMVERFHYVKVWN